MNSRCSSFRLQNQCLKSPETGELRRVQAPQSACLAAPLLLRADGEEEEADDGEQGDLKVVRMVVRLTQKEKVQK